MVSPSPRVAPPHQAYAGGVGEPRRRREDDPARALIPAQRGPQSPRRAPVVSAPVVGAPARHRRIGLNPDLARVALCGALLFGALVAELSAPAAAPSPASATQHSAAHRPAAPRR